VTVCKTCGVEVAEARIGKLVHLGAIPREVAEHDIEVVEALEDFDAREALRFELKAAIEEMIAHHGTLHPLADCRWAEKLATLLELS